LEYISSLILQNKKTAAIKGYGTRKLSRYHPYSPRDEGALLILDAEYGTAYCQFSRAAQSRPSHYASRMLAPAASSLCICKTVLLLFIAFTSISIVQTSEYCQLFLSVNMLLTPTKSRIFNCLHLFVSSHFIVAIISREAKR
jgi:hypothetical protein